MDKQKHYWRWHYLFTGFVFHLGAISLTFVGLSSGVFFEANPSMAFILESFGWLGAIIFIVGAYGLLAFFVKRRSFVARFALFFFAFNFSHDLILVGLFA